MSARGMRFANVAAGGGIAAAAAVAAVKYAQWTNEHAQRRSEELAPYSGSILTAQTRISLAQLTQDISQARRHGSGFAESIEASAEADRAWQKFADTAAIGWPGRAWSEVKLRTARGFEKMIGGDPDAEARQKTEFQPLDFAEDYALAEAAMEAKGQAATFLAALAKMAVEPGTAEVKDSMKPDGLIPGSYADYMKGLREFSRKRFWDRPAVDPTQNKNLFSR